MKKLLFFCCITLLLPFMAKALNPIVDFAVFRQPDHSAYAEIYVLIAGNDLLYRPTPAGTWQAKADITLIFTAGTQVAQYDRYVLLGKELPDTAGIKPNLLDLKRFPLPPGSYELEVSMADANNPLQTARRTATLTIPAPDVAAISMSDVMLADAFVPTATTTQYTKYGYEIVPNILGYYPPQLNRLSFYTEVYNAAAVLGSGADFMCTYAVVNNRRMVVNGLRKFKKLKADAVNILMAELDISALPSGNYYIWVEVRNKQNEVIAENAVVFQRNNPDASANAPALVMQGDGLDKLPDDVPAYLLALSDAEAAFYLDAIMPVATELEYQFAQNALNAKDPGIIKRSLAAFWQQHEPVDPALAFSLYKEQTDYVEKTYQTIKQHGYQTDRGRVFLKYGHPNDLVQVTNEPGALPYEIWHYYKLNNKQVNVKFVFYQPILASNDYQLIHSDARGEVKDPRWQMRIYNTMKEQSNSNNLDTEQIRNHFGGKATDFFNDN